MSVQYHYLIDGLHILPNPIFTMSHGKNLDFIRKIANSYSYSWKMCQNCLMGASYWVYESGLLSLFTCVNEVPSKVTVMNLKHSMKLPKISVECAWNIWLKCLKYLINASVYLHEEASFCILLNSLIVTIVTHLTWLIWWLHNFMEKCQNGCDAVW